MTQTGSLLGTAAYMSPEQARGDPADRRADIWAFGVVLMEMLTGKPTYAARTASDTLAGVLKEEPAWGDLPSPLPPSIRRLLERCLEKEATERLQAIGEARIAIKSHLANPEADVLEAPVEGTSGLSSRKKAMLSGAGLALGILLVLSVWVLKPGPPPPEPLHVEVLLRAEAPLLLTVGSSMVFSPNGQRLAYISGAVTGGSRLHLRSLGQFDGQLLSGNELAYNPFFSPDGNWVGFSTPYELKKVSISGGASLKLCDVYRSRGASWSADGTIVFAPNLSSGLMQVSAAGGEPEELTTLEEGEVTHRWPQFLPGDQQILFTARHSPRASRRGPG